MSLHKTRLKLKDRVGLALLALVTLFVVVQGALAFLSIEEQEDDLADEWVLSESQRLQSLADRGELNESSAAELFRPTPTLSAWMITGTGQEIPGRVPAHLRNLTDGPYRLSAQDAELHVVIRQTAQGRLYVQYDASGPEAKVHRFGLYLLGSTATCILLCLFVSRWMASIVVEPINRLTEQLSNWAPEARSVRAASSDEEHRLLEAFHGVQARFEETIAREREYVANVRHEVRTPLAALRTDIEMLALSEQAQSARSVRLQRALAMVDAIAAGLESAHLLNRRSHSISQAIELARCVDDAWSSLAAYPGIDRLRFVNAVPPATIVHADRHALLTILRNLIRNAAEHAAPAQCTVSHTDRGIEVADDGPGIEARELPMVFERYYRGRLADTPGENPDDHGIGLAIARQVADLNGWTLTASSSPDQGACFVLRIP